MRRRREASHEEINGLEPNETFRCDNEAFVRCTAMLVPENLAIVYAKRETEGPVTGAAICPETLAGTCGDMPDGEIAWAEGRHAGLKPRVRA